MELKSFREDKLKMTQAQFAELIEEEQSNISRWEKSGEPPLSVIQKICKKAGVDFNTLLGWAPPVYEPFKTNNCWGRAKVTKENLIKFLKASIEKLDILEAQKMEYTEGLLRIVESIRKPKVAIVGRSDTGKSTMINSLIGKEKIPTSWTPTTSIAIYIKHISDRPSFIEEDVWVFANEMDGENAWNEHKLQDEEYCRKWKIGAGTVDILRSHGTRQGENYSENAGAAVVFLDAPILQNCDIVDLPGFGTEEEKDDNITFKITKEVDAIIYLSQANGFMRIEDINYLKRNIKELPVWEKNGETDLEPLCNLFVVGSHAHTVCGGNNEELENIFDDGCARLIKTLSEYYWSDRSEVSGHDYFENQNKYLRKRFFAYTTDIPTLNGSFNQSLKKLVETLPRIVEKNIKEEVLDFVEIQKLDLSTKIKEFEDILNQREKYENLLREIKKSETKRINSNNEKKGHIRSELQRLLDESKKEFTDYWLRNVNIDAISKNMNEKNVKNNSEELKSFVCWFQDILTGKCEEILKRKSKEAKEIIYEYARSFKENIPNDIHFNADVSFNTALERCINLGAGGAYLGGCFAIGAGGVLLAGGVALGPIALLVAGALLATVGAIRLFGKTWEKSCAKKIVKKLDEETILEEILEQIKLFWREKEDRFNQAAESLDKQFKEYVEDLENLINNYDVDEIKRKINNLQYIKSFFDSIPL